MKFLCVSAFLFLCAFLALSDACSRCGHSKEDSPARNLKTYVPVDPKKQTNVPSNAVYTTKRYLDDAELELYDSLDAAASEARELKASYIPSIPIEIPVVSKKAYTPVSSKVAFHPTTHKGRYLADEDNADLRSDEMTDTDDLVDDSDADVRRLKNYIPRAVVTPVSTKTVYRPVQSKTVYRPVTATHYVPMSKKGRYLGEEEDEEGDTAAGIEVEASTNVEADQMDVDVETEEDDVESEEEIDTAVDVPEESGEDEEAAEARLLKEYIASKPVAPVTSKTVYRPVQSKTVYRPVTTTTYVPVSTKGRYLGEEDEEDTAENQLGADAEFDDMDQEAAEARELKAYASSTPIASHTKTVYRPVQTKTVYRPVTTTTYVPVSKKGRYLGEEEEEDEVEQAEEDGEDDVPSVPSSEEEAESRMLKEYTRPKSYAPVYTARVIPVSKKVYRPIVTKKSSYTTYRPTSSKSYRYLGEIDDDGSESMGDWTAESE